MRCTHHTIEVKSKREETCDREVLAFELCEVHLRQEYGAYSATLATRLGIYGNSADDIVTYIERMIAIRAVLRGAKGER